MLRWNKPHGEPLLCGNGAWPAMPLAKVADVFEDARPRPFSCEA